MNSYQIIKTRLESTKQQNEALIGQMTDLLNMVDKATAGETRSPLRRKATTLRKKLSSFHASESSLRA